MATPDSTFIIDGKDKWYEKAMVRIRDHVIDGPEWSDAYSLYNTELTPFTQHPLVQGLGPRVALELGAGRLADYLAKTEVVELEIVNRAVEKILRRPDISEDMRLDLLKVYTDEGYHVLMMVEFRNHIYEKTGLWLGRRPARELDEIVGLIESFPPQHRDLAVICCAIVTETLITGTLRQAGKGTVYPSVQKMLAEHAADEARHHAFFHRFAEQLLPGAMGKERHVVEDVFRQVLWYFLCPDFGRLRDELVAHGLTSAQATAVIDESFDRDELCAQFTTASAASRRLMSTLGLDAGHVFLEQLGQLQTTSLLQLVSLEPRRKAERA
jgi:hypothetical protein